MNAMMEIVIIIIVGVVGWFLKVGFDSVMKKVDGKMDKGCHDICTKEKEKMNTLLLEEIRGLRQDFATKSEIVVKAVGGKV